MHWNIVGNTWDNGVLLTSQCRNVSYYTFKNKPFGKSIWIHPVSFETLFFLMQRFNFHFQEATKQRWPLVTFQYVRLLFVLYSKSFNFHCWTKAFWICHLGIFSDALQPTPAYAFKMKLVEVAVQSRIGKKTCCHVKPPCFYSGSTKHWLWIGPLIDFKYFSLTLRRTGCGYT